MSTDIIKNNHGNKDLFGFTPDIFNALKSSIYPGAKDESILMVLAYCRAKKLDPMLKCVHIVPMPVSSGRKDNNGYDIMEFRDVVMPGIGLYRIQADRTGKHAGTSEPEYGPNITETIGTKQITYPEYCIVKVYKIVHGQIVVFAARELWKENYAQKSSKDLTPNKMWSKRIYGQLGKCAEAQALRKAFPDDVDSQPTAEEMEGKIIENDFISISEISEKSNSLNKILEDSKVVEKQENHSEKEKEVEKRLPYITYDTIITGLKSAKNVSELSEVMNKTNKLTNPDEKRQALKQFRECKEVLERPPLSDEEFKEYQKALD